MLHICDNQVQGICTDFFATLEVCIISACFITADIQL